MTPTNFDTQITAVQAEITSGLAASQYSAKDLVYVAKAIEALSNATTSSGVFETSFVNGVLYVGPAASNFETAAALTNPVAVFQIAADDYAQIAFKNTSSNANSSTDFIAYSNNGDDSSGYIDMGITSSNFLDPDFTITGKGDGYIFMVGAVGGTDQGNLVFATGDTGSQNKIIFAAGGLASDNEQMSITPDTNVHIEISTQSTSPTTGALTVVGGVGITGNLNIAGNLTFGGEGSSLETTTLAVSDPLIFVGSNNRTDAVDLGLIAEYASSTTTITKAISNKALTSNVATLTTSTTHGFAVGDIVVVGSVDATFNGTYVVKAVPTTTTFTYDKTNANVTSAAVSPAGAAEVTTKRRFAGVVRDASDGVVKFFKDATTSPSSTINLSEAGLSYADIKTAGISASTLDITGDLTGGASSDIAINTNKFTVNASTGDTAVAGTLSASGNLAVNTNKFTVAATSGNTVVAGTLGVASDLAVNTDKFTVNSTTGNATIAGALTTGSLTNTLLEMGTGNAANTVDLGLYATAAETVATPISATVATKSLTGNVATLTTSATHNLLAGDSVAVSNVDATFNGTYTITTIPSSTSFSYAKTADNVSATAATSTGTFTVTNKALTSNIATLTTATAHGFTTGESVVVSNVDATFNGTYTIASTPTTTTFTYAKTASDVTSQSAKGSLITVTFKALASNVATITTATTHGFSSGQSVVIAGVDSTFNGTYTILTTPTSTTFTYAKVAANVATSPAGASPSVVTTKALTSNVATLTTATNHGLTTGQYVSVANVDSTFNGVWLVASTPTATTFTYAVIASNVTSQEAGINAGTLVTVKDLTSNVATLSTFTAHGLNVGDTVVIAGVDVNHNGTYTVTAVPTLYSFSYTKSLAYNQAAHYAGTGSQSTITTASLTTNVITYTTAATHNIIAGSWVTIIGANDNVYNGTYIVASIPTTTTFTVNKANVDVASATVNGTAYALNIAVTNVVLTSNVATLTTSVAHGLTAGQYISVMGISSTFNGIYQISTVPSSTTLSYTRVSANIATAVTTGASRIAPLLGTVVRRVGTSSVTAGTSATLTGTAASSTLAGTATVAAPVRTTYSGLVKKASDSVFRLFTGLRSKPTTTVDLAGTGLTYGGLQINGLTATSASLSSTLSVTGASTFSGDVSGTSSSGYVNFNPKVNNLGTVTGSTSVSVSSGSVILIQPIANTSITFTNMPANGYAGFWEVEVISPGANTVTFNGVTWNGGSAPALQVGSKKTVFTFRTRDGGSTIYGSTSFNDIV
jgi:hypothetical protein